MIRWILDRSWLPITLYASCLALISAGFELVSQNFLGLIFSFLLFVNIFISRKFTWVSLGLLPLTGFAATYFTSGWCLSVFEVALTVFLLGIFASKKQLILLYASSVALTVVSGWSLGYQSLKLLGLFGVLETTELQRVNALLLAMALSGSLFALAVTSGRLVFLRVEHVGSPLDQAYSRVNSGKLKLEIAKQNERLEIAKDLSELLVQRISAVVSVTEGGRYAIVTEPKAAERVLDRAYEAARSAQSELRRLYDYLNSAIISDSASFTIADLQELVIAFRELGYNTVLSEQGTRFALNEGMELCVYKIVFEALQNVRKHCEIGTEIGIDFLWVEDGLQILVKDNGVEFVNRQRQSVGELTVGYTAEEDLESLITDFDGATLAALRDRAAIYNGRIEATAVPGVGFTLSAIFPHLKNLVAQEL